MNSNYIISNIISKKGTSLPAVKNSGKKRLNYKCY